MKPRPAGSIVATAGDMAKFMLAHLQGKCYDGSCILQPATLAEMHRQQAKTPYKGQAVTYGFVEAQEGSVRLVGHSGAIRGFGSSMNLLPDYDMGYFFSFNAECDQTSACNIIPAFRKQFIEQFMRK
ncbi:MAG: serine hydrolase [Anaerolineae bacterium]|nr:serine hydrolase [Anaerolineae bacterium]